MGLMYSPGVIYLGQNAGVVKIALSFRFPIHKVLGETVTELELHRNCIGTEMELFFVFQQHGK
jgi:hypothetical protein